jgi:hypothetical protein
MRNLKGGPVDTDQMSPKFEGFEQRLLDELKLMVAERRVDAADPVVTVSAGRPPFRMPVWRRVGLAAIAGVAAGALAVAVLFAGGVVGSGPGEHSDLSSFLARAAAAARSHPVAPPKPGQVFVERVKVGETGPKTENKVGCFEMVYDTPATGRGTFPTKSGHCGANGASTLIRLITMPSGHHHPVTHGYPDPAKLPADPKALLAALNRDAAHGHWDDGTVDLVGAEFWSTNLPRNGIVFGLIERLLQVPIRPALRAALFAVTGHLPGVSLERHATDLIGRPGVGISLLLPVKDSASGLRLEFVLNPKTYEFLGFGFIDGIGNRAHPQKFGYAVITSYLVVPAEPSPR